MGDYIVAGGGVSGLTAAYRMVFGLVRDRETYEIDGDHPGVRSPAPGICRCVTNSQLQRP
jgi:hypothetical protein